MSTPKKSEIQVVQYDPSWPSQFEAEAQKIKKALGDNCMTIHHVGSTSIIGIHAKPIIDMIPVVKDILEVDKHNDDMQALGYTSRGENGMPFRRFFQRKTGIHANVHVFEVNDPEIERNLVFRDHMNKNPTDREAYGNLKIQLSTQVNDITKYVLAKDPFIQNIYRKIQLESMRFVEALTENEWKGYRKIMQEEIFGPIGIEFDPSHWTMTAQDHRKFIFMKGTVVIGAAMLAFMGENDCILRTFAIDHDYQNQGFGKQFLQLLIRWSQHQGKKTMLLHSRIDVVQFYKTAGFSLMAFVDPSLERLNEEVIDLGRVL
jgi:GrpB-like predicted nucleotidyltransferase (UPF0157 family)